MYYFKFHIRDYAAATTYLSNEEDLAYRRLLDMYYSTEAPIPLDVTLVAKRIRCEPTAVRDVLNEKFTRTDDGFRHERCDAEIADYRQSAERNRANGRAGGRPKKPSGLPAGSQSVASGNPVETQSKPSGNPNHKPLTINHEEQRDVELAFDRWRELFNKNGAKLDDKRRRCIAKAVKSHGIDKVLDCLAGYTKSTFHMGQNDRNTKYDDITVFLRDATNIERGLELNAQPKRSTWI